MLQLNLARLAELLKADQLDLPTEAPTAASTKIVKTLSKASVVVNFDRRADILGGKRSSRDAVLAKATVDFDRLQALIKADGTQRVSVRAHMRNGRPVRAHTSDRARGVAATPPPQEVAKQESRIRTKREEHGAIHVGGEWHQFGPEDTRRYYDQTGGFPQGKSPANTIHIPAHIWVAMQDHGDAVAIHNHPDGKPPSVQDLIATVDSNSAELRVVSPLGGSWVVRRPPRGWPSGKDMELHDPDWRELQKRVYARASMRMIDIMTSYGGDPNADDPQAEPGYSDEVWNGLIGQEQIKILKSIAQNHGFVIEYEGGGTSHRRLASGIHGDAVERAERHLAAFEASIGEETP